MVSWSRLDSWIHFHFLLTVPIRRPFLASQTGMLSYKSSRDASAALRMYFLYSFKMSGTVKIFWTVRITSESKGQRFSDKVAILDNMIFPSFLQPLLQFRKARSKIVIPDFAAFVSIYLFWSGECSAETRRYNNKNRTNFNGEINSIKTMHIFLVLLLHSVLLWNCDCHLFTCSKLNLCIHYPNQWHNVHCKA